MSQIIQQSDEKQKANEQELEVKEKAKTKKKRNLRLVYAAILLVIAYICAMAVYILVKAPVKEKPDVRKAETAKASVEEKIVNYEEISYSITENYQKYDEYIEHHPEIEAEDAVWMVNVNLDMPMYGCDIEVNGYNDPYIIVNKYYKVPEDYRPPDLVKTDGYLMRAKTSKAYKKMCEDAKSEGLNLRVVSAYRSVEYQKSLYDKYLKYDLQETVDRHIARPCYSEHHTGMALDLFGSVKGLDNFESTPEYAWIEKNCHKYGFIIRYHKETEHITGYTAKPWHIRYVGTEVSTAMKEKNIKSFEEYHAKYLK